MSLLPPSMPPRIKPKPEPGKTIYEFRKPSDMNNKSKFSFKKLLLKTFNVRTDAETENLRINWIENIDKD